MFNTPFKEKDEVDKKNKIVDKERKEGENYLFFYFVIEVADIVKNMLKDLWISTKRLFEQKTFRGLLRSNPHTTVSAYSLKPCFLSPASGWKDLAFLLPEKNQSRTNDILAPFLPADYTFRFLIN